jgi:hypothetical protein
MPRNPGPSTRNPYLAPSNRAKFADASAGAMM